MFRKVYFKNFRKFSQFSLNLGSGNILVGPNNAGKSSILDAFRLLEACLRNSRQRNPQVLNVPSDGFVDGYEIPDSVLPFRLSNIAQDYEEDDAIVEFQHKNGRQLMLRLHPDRQTRMYIRPQGTRLNSASRFRAAFPLHLVIVPTLSPLEAEEPWVSDETVRRNSTNRLASRVLRNIWLRASFDEFEKFRRVVEPAWPGVVLKKPEQVPGFPPIVEMYFSENRRDREVQWAGFGFQVWLQLCSHLSRGTPDSVVIVDEPDIYLHPDIQRRLLAQVRNAAGQFLMATHSIEIINEAESNEILSINSNYRSAKSIRSEEDYASVFKYLGSASNADFARIARARKVVFVEGKDHKLLRKFGKAFGFTNLADAQNVPIIQLGGFANWTKATNAVWAFKQVLDLEIEAFCLFDRDYRSEEEISQFEREVAAEGLRCCVLGRKEIENYLLQAIPLRRAVSRVRRTRNPGAEDASEEEVRNLLAGITDAFKSYVCSLQMAKYLQYCRERRDRRDDSTLIFQFNNSFESNWSDINFRLKVVPGKDVVSRVSEALQVAGNGSLTPSILIDNMRAEECDEEFLQTLRLLDDFCLN